MLAASFATGFCDAQAAPRSFPELAPTIPERRNAGSPPPFPLFALKNLLCGAFRLPIARRVAILVVLYAEIAGLPPNRTRCI